MWFELFLPRCLLRAERLPCWQISGSCFLGFARVHGPAESQPAPCSVASGTGFELSLLFTEIIYSTVLKKSSVWFLNFLIQYYSGTFILLQFAPWQIPSVRVPKSLQRNSKLRCDPCGLARCVQENSCEREEFSNTRWTLESWKVFPGPRIAVLKS